MAVDPKHMENAAKSRAKYLDNLRPMESAADWRFAVNQARELVAPALEDSLQLTDIGRALTINAAHTLVFRQMLAPPLSQDQFKLVCNVWNKGSENNSRPMQKIEADEVARIIIERFDAEILTLAAGGSNGMSTVSMIASILMAAQKVATARRSRLALEQEKSITSMLEREGWIKLPSKLIDIRAAVPPKSFMHKTRFATNTTAHQEVDVACGLNRSYVVALECKVTNDETNSVKRVNDVLKKASAWKAHWGSFVIPAALLQGVVAGKDAQRLTDAGVKVFWSHDLDEFLAWLTNQV